MGYPGAWEFKHGVGKLEPISTGGTGPGWGDAVDPPASGMRDAASQARHAKPVIKRELGKVAPSQPAVPTHQGRSSTHNADDDFRHGVGQHYGATVGSYETPDPHAPILGGVVPTGKGSGNRMVYGPPQH